MELLEFLLNKDDIGEAPWTYDHFLNLEESEYPKYLKKIFKIRTGKNLNLKHPKTFNEKIQWIKLYGVTDLMRDCTDKVKVRDYVKERIGEEYLKPVLQICNNFDEIAFDKLPNQFVIKCNHGCKWHSTVKDKEKLLSTPKVLEITKNKMTDWLNREFWPWEGFELNYKGIEPKILIEPYMPANRHIEIYCFNGIPKIYSDIHLENETKICIYNEDFSYSDLVLKKEDEKYICEFYADDTLKQAVKLSKKLNFKVLNSTSSIGFKNNEIVLEKNSISFPFVRVDWMSYENKLYFEELTFTPYSGFTMFNEKWNKKLGNWIEV